MADKTMSQLFSRHIYFDAPDQADDVILEGSDSELSDRGRKRKRAEIEHAAKEYLLHRRAPYLISTKLIGSFTNAEGHRNPWRKEGRVRKKVKAERLSPKPEERDLSVIPTLEFRARAQRPDKYPPQPASTSDSDAAQDRGTKAHVSRPEERLSTKSKREVDATGRDYGMPNRRDSLSRGTAAEADYSEIGTSETRPKSQRPGRTSSEESSTLDERPTQYREPPMATIRPLHPNMPPPCHSTRQTALQKGTDEPWLKRRLFSRKSVWDTPSSGTPTPTKAAATDPPNERQRRDPIFRTPSSRSSQSGASETASHQMTNDSLLQHAQPSRASSFGNTYKSIDSKWRQSSVIEFTSLGLPAKIDPMAQKNAAFERRASSGKKRSELNSEFKGSVTLRSTTRYSSEKPRDQSPFRDEQSRALSTTKSAQSASEIIRSEDRAMRSVERDVDSADDDDILRSEDIDMSFYQHIESTYGHYQAAQQYSGAVETPLSAQLGSFSKYQLPLPKFDSEHLQSQESAGDDLAFSFSGMSPQVSRRSMESFSRPASAHSQSRPSKPSFEKRALMVIQRQLSPAERNPLYQPAPASKFVNNGFQSSRIEELDRDEARKGAERGAQRSIQGHEKVTEEIATDTSNSKITARPDMARLLRSMNFEEDDSPGFLGPRRQRHKEKTKLKELQTLTMTGEASQAEEAQESVKPREAEALPVIPAISEVQEPPKVVLSTAKSVNTIEEPLLLAEADEVEDFVGERVAKMSSGSKFVMSNIMAIEITPQKRRRSPRQQVKTQNSAKDVVDTSLQPPQLSPQEPVVEARSSSVIKNASPLPKPNTTSQFPKEPIDSRSPQSDQVPSINELEPLPSPKATSEIPVQYQEVQEESQNPMVHGVVQAEVEDDVVAQGEPMGSTSPTTLTAPATHQINVHAERIVSTSPTTLAALAADQINIHIGPMASRSSSTSKILSNHEVAAREESLASTFTSALIARASDESQNSPTRKAPHTIPKASSHPESSAVSPLQSSQRRPEESRSQSTDSRNLVGLGEAPQAEDALASQATQSSWSFNDTTLSDPSRIDSSAILMTTPQAKTPIGHSALSKVECNAVPEKRGGASLELVKLSLLSPEAKDAEEDVETSRATKLGKGPANLNTVLDDEGRAPLHTEELSSSEVQARITEEDAELSSNQRLRDARPKGSRQPSISIEYLEISSDDEEEDIPHDRPVQISSLRNSFLSPKRKKKRPKRAPERTLRKPISFGPQTPDRLPAKNDDQPRSATKTPIQAIDEDPMTEEEARLYAEFEAAEPQSPWNTDDAVPLTPVFLPAVMEAHFEDPRQDTSSPNARSRSSSLRVASDLQTGWDDCGFEYISRHATTDKPLNDDEFDFHKDHPLSQHSNSELLEGSAPPMRLSGLQPFSSFETPSPVKNRKRPVELLDEFPNTQALRDAALNNPWMSASTVRKSVSNKRVSFAAALDDDSQRPTKRKCFNSPPPASDDSQGIDGTEDKLVKRLCAAKTLKLGEATPSSPPADAVALAFIAADKQALGGTTPPSKRKRATSEFENATHSHGTSSRQAKRQDRHSQPGEDEDEDGFASSFEISPDGRVTPMKSRKGSALRKKRPCGRLASRGNGGESGKDDIAALVENNLEKVISDVFHEGWDIDEELRRIDGGGGSSAAATKGSGRRKAWLSGMMAR